MTVALLLADYATPTHAAFQQWLQSTWPDAQQLGVSCSTLDAGIRGLEPDLTLPDLAVPSRAKKAPQQTEFVQTPVSRPFQGAAPMTSPAWFSPSRLLGRAAGSCASGAGIVELFVRGLSGGRGMRSGPSQASRPAVS